MHVCGCVKICVYVLQMGTEVLSGGEREYVLILCYMHICLCMCVGVCVCTAACVEVILARTACLVFLPLHTI